MPQSGNRVAAVQSFASVRRLLPSSIRIPQMKTLFALNKDLRTKSVFEPARAGFYNPLPTMNFTRSTTRLE